MAFNGGEVVNNKYKVVKKLGEGSFGSVFLMKGIVPPLEQFALKVLKNISVNEINIGLVLGNKFPSPFLIKFKEVFEKEGVLMIVMDYCDGGNLSERIRQKGPATDSEIYPFLFASSSALKTLHDANIIHRDIKPANFFILLSGGYKLGDYGLARLLDTLKSGSMAGSSGYTAPEILQGKRDYTTKVDIFSLGTTLMEFILGHNPFSEPGEDVNMLRIIQGSPVEAALRHTHPVMQLARRMIAADPTARPTIDEVLAALFPMSSLLTPLHAVHTELEGVMKEKVAAEEALRKAQAEVESVRKKTSTLGRAGRVFLVGPVYGDSTCSGPGGFMESYMSDGLTVGSIVFSGKEGTPSHPCSVAILRHGVGVAWAPASSLAGAVGVGAVVTLSN